MYCETNRSGVKLFTGFLTEISPIFIILFISKLTSAAHFPFPPKQKNEKYVLAKLMDVNDFKTIQVNLS